MKMVRFIVVVTESAALVFVVVEEKRAEEVCAHATDTFTSADAKAEAVNTRVRIPPRRTEEA